MREGWEGGERGKMRVRDYECMSGSDRRAKCG